MHPISDVIEKRPVLHKLDFLYKINYINMQYDYDNIIYVNMQHDCVDM